VSRLKKTLYILGSLVLFVFALDLMISSFQHLGETAAETILLATSNPFTGLFIGLLITAMIQSSSTVTSLVVALVASGAITLDSAIPIIMGANIGTTITSTIVSLGFINKKKEFRRAVAAGTYHDSFNILTVVILFPLEYYFGFLSNLSIYITGYLFPIQQSVGTPGLKPIWSGFTPVIDFLINLIPSGFLLALLSFALLFGSILLFRRIISGLLLVNSPQNFSRFFFKSMPGSFLWGLLTTAAIRSSTITSSVVVPLVAQKITTLQKAASFIMGANIGTTVTAFLAAFLNSNSSNAISIAVAHFLFNLLGVLIFFPIPVLRNIPIALANGLGRLTIRYRLTGFVYILVIFFFLPFSLIYLNRDAIEVYDLTYKVTAVKTGESSSYRIVSKQQLNNRTGEWLVYRRGTNDPDEIYPVYRKNNVLFVNKEMIPFNDPGFCFDGENMEGKYKLCVTDILKTFTTSSGITFDSVYLYSQHYYNLPDSVSSTVYISARYSVVIKTLRKENEVLVETREIVDFKRK
jgi:solute carrier family 34 (sodium-dependent phosphate cotransporter)